MYGVHIDVYTHHKSLKYVFTQKGLNLHQRRWFKLLKYYDMCVLYHPSKVNVVADTLIRMTVGSVSNVVDAKKDLVKGFHRLARLDERLEDLRMVVLWCIINLSHHWLSS